MKSFVVAIAAVAGWIAQAATPAAAQAPLLPRQKLDLPQLRCTVKSGEVVSVLNEKTEALLKGTVVTVSYSPKPSGSSTFNLSSWGKLPSKDFTLTRDLAPGQSVDFDLQAEDCSATFVWVRPDLEVLDVVSVAGQLKLRVRNSSTLADAGGSTARVRLMKCTEVELGAVDVSVPPVQKGQTLTVFRPTTFPAGFQYFNASADVHQAVKESNEKNNAFSGVGICIQ